MEAPRSSCDYDEVRAWIAANRKNLPQTYDEIIQFSVPYRRAIFSELPPHVRSQLWVEQLARYRDTHQDLSVGQRELLDRAIAILGEETLFQQGSAPDPRLRRLEEDSVAEFGRERARELFATLGPP